MNGTVSNKCQSKEQNEEKDKLPRGGSIGLRMHLWVNWKRERQWWEEADGGTK
ncbi:MAG: hypothetical protein HDR06_19065 [Lachnospiraceae bacterium]|nr:hypothetical protein [Lachnospiraceae bacterium]